MFMGVVDLIIKRIEVKNFRSIRESTLNCDNLTAIVGRNGAGKSSFLYAIDVFYDIAAPITEEDFFNRDTGSTIEIRMTYGNLREDEKEEFQTYIQDDKLIVTKRISLDENRFYQRYYAAALQIPQFAEIRSLPGKRERVTGWNQLVESGELDRFERTARSADQVEQLMAEYETSHQQLMVPIERVEQFFGPKNIGGGKLDNFTKFVLVPAVREAEEEVIGKKGAILQILDMIVLRKINAREDVREFKTEFEDKMREIYSAENLTELPELGNSISQTLEKFAPGSQLNLGWDEIKPPQIPLPVAKATLVEDRFEGEITRKGHGLQRALIVTLLQHLAVTIPIEPPSEEGEVETPITEVDSSQGPDLIIAFEEPELYLHPSRCRYLSSLLLQLAESPDFGLGASNQIIYTTHTPYFLDLHRFDQIRMVRKETSPDSPILQSTVISYSLEEAANELARIKEADPASFTRDSFKARAMSVMNTIVNEGYFADVVVVVEGPSDVCTLWKLQEIMDKNWHGLGIVVVPAGGKNNIDRPVVIFRGLSIPTYFIFDGDSYLEGQGQKGEEVKKRNHRYLRLANVPIEDFPDTKVEETWAVFKENLEGIFNDALGDSVLRNIQEEVATELGYDRVERACKNIEGASRFIEIVYERGHRIDILEEIIEKVTQLL